MQRKIIQLVPVSHGLLGLTISLTMYALCNDGTIWYRHCYDEKNSNWKPVTDDVPGTKS